MFEFAWPWIFVILPLPYLVWLLLPSAPQDNTALNVTFIKELENISGQTAHSTNISWKKVLPYLIVWGLLVCASARPQWIGDSLPIQPTGRDLLIAVDTSGSMQEDDITWQGKNVDRLTLIQKLFKPFIENRFGDRIGLILFGSNAYLHAPLTFDRKTVSTWLDESMIGIAGTQTAIGDAIALGVKRLYNQEEKSRVLVLITDGSNNSGNKTPEEATALAAEAKVKIYTIGIGSDKMLNYGFSRIPASADLDEPALIEIAQKTGGKYFRARTEADLVNISKELDKLEPVNQQMDQTRYIQEYYIWPLSFATLLSILLVCYKLFPQIIRWRPL